jgi:hypothetical protein
MNQLHKNLKFDECRCTNEILTCKTPPAQQDTIISWLPLSCQTTENTATDKEASMKQQKHAEKSR